MRRAPHLQVRMLGLLTVLALLAALLVGRLGQLQASGPDEAAGAAAAPDTRTVAVPALRGRILDRDGVPIADNDRRTDVTIDRRVLADSDDGGRALVRRVAEALDRPVDELWARTTLCGAPGAADPPRCWPGSAYVPVPVVEGVAKTEALALTETPERYPGVQVVTSPVRSYPRIAGGGGAPQTIGYLTRADAETVAESDGTLAEGDLAGAAGLEQHYDEELRGRPGQRVVRVDGRGVVVEEVSRTAAQPGRDLVTTLDVGVQRAAERALADGMADAQDRDRPATSGGAVVLDLAEGGVVASASRPTYDPAVWSGPVTQERYEQLTSGGDNPLVDRVLGVAQPPASTFKAVTLPGAVRAGVDLERPVPCTASYRIGDREFRNFESRAYGTISWHQALVVSCDTVFYRVAEQVWRDQGGIDAESDHGDPLIETARSFGLGEATGVDLPGEVDGRIPGREWKREYWEQTKDEACARAEDGYPGIEDGSRADYLTRLAEETCRRGYRYQPGDEVNLSIGQGDVTTTLLQMAQVYGTIARAGSEPQPHLGDALVTVDGQREELSAPEPEQVDIPEGSGALIRDALADVVTEGTAASAFADADLPAWSVAGKTGTAEVFGEEDTSWFVSWGPTSDPRYVVAVVVDEGGTGGSTAAGIAADIHEHLAAHERG